MKNKFKKLLSIIMVVIMTACALPMKEFRMDASALTWDEYWNKAQAFINDSRWANGASYSYYQQPKMSGAGSGQGCNAYARDFVKYVYNVGWKALDSNGFTDPSEIRSGDILYVTPTHWIVVLKRDGNTLYTAEGSWNGVARVTSSGYTINGSTFSGSGKTFSQGIHYLDASVSSYANLGDDFYGIILNTACWKPITQDFESQKVYLGKELGVAYQKWHFVRQSDGAYAIFSCYDGKALEMTNGICTAGTQITAHGWWNGSYQQWYIIPYGNGFIFQSKHFSNDNWVLDLKGNSSDDSTAIQIYNRNNSAAQIWSIYKQDDVQLKASQLSIDVLTPSVTFNWTRVYGAKYYDLKIWKNKVWDGDAFLLKFDTKSGTTIDLPPGTYQAYVDTRDYYQIFMSNVVTFTVNSVERKVYFDATGGLCALENKSVIEKSTYGTLPTPTKTGYIFDGWYTSKEGGMKITADSKVSITADQTLYAHWTKKEIIIKKDSNIVFDEENNLIMNVPEGISNLDNLLEINGLSLKYEETANGFGTGTKVKVMDGTSVLKTYTIVVPCDVTGDGYCDAFDVSLLSSVANYETEFEENSAYLFAGDNVQDGFIDSFDVSVLTAKANYEI